MVSNIRETAGFQTAGTGASRCSAYWRIQFPLNSTIFVAKKKSGKWRIGTDRRAINKVIQAMDSL